MAEIDVQNAKQIRDPMQVLITMSLAVDDVDMSYSGYSSAKVADGVLDKRDWAMRKLADLQGDGFLLDGTHVLYDANVTPSQANGKLGVRSNVGEAVSVTATGDKTIASLGVNVTGAESVTYNGVTTQITGNTVTIPILNYSVVLTFNPATETDRIEVAYAEPEADFKITNDNLIRATVSLRSDLSIIEPTLPESEINIEVYNDIDISEAVAEIPEDTPIIYQAGYEGDMSDPRKFYVSGQVTWADNVLSIHAVDAVHFLDSPTEMLGLFGWGYYNRQNETLDTAYYSIGNMLQLANINAVERKTVSFHMGYFNEITRARTVIERGRTCRDIIAQFMQLMHIDNIPDEYFFGSRKGSFWLTYVDAGIPTLQATLKPSSAKWSIIEDDCGDVKKTVEPIISTLIVNNKSATATGFVTGEEDVTQSALEVGSIDWQKGQGAFVSIDEGAYRITYGLGRSDGVTPEWEYDYVLPILPADSLGRYFEIAPYILPYYSILFDGETQQKYYNDRKSTIYTQVIPWNAHYANANRYRWYSQASAWAGLVSLGIIDRNAETFQLKVFGNKVAISENQTEYKSGRVGVTREIQTGWIGRLAFCDENSQNVQDALPDWGYRSLFDKSNITGSFTWKGDPRMQPRDVAEFERLDGTTELITLENITLTHEGGGTSAEITYRKGVV